MQKNQRVFDSSYLIFLLALFYVVVLWWFGLSLRSFILIDSEWRKTFSNSSSNKRGVAGRKRTLGWHAVSSGAAGGNHKFPLIEKKKCLLAREFFTSQSEFRQWSPRLSSNQFIQTDACLHLKYTSTNGRKPAIGLAARRLITIPEVFFFVLFSFSFFSHSITWRSFQSNSRSCSFYTQTWCGTLQSVDVDWKKVCDFLW